MIRRHPKPPVPDPGECDPPGGGPARTHAWLEDFLDAWDDDDRFYCRPILTCSWCLSIYDPDDPAEAIG